jgi:acyl-CoA reductase-like NAD-dependent aldehyde dehydrogenase
VAWPGERDTENEMAYQTISPATGEFIRTFPDISDTELEAAVRQAQATYETDWRHRAVADRARIVAAAAATLREHAEEYAGYLTLEMGKLIAEARAEVSLSADILDYYARRAGRYLTPQPIAEAPGSIVETLPLGIILGVEPWNFPYYQLARFAGRTADGRQRGDDEARGESVPQSPRLRGAVRGRWAHLPASIPTSSPASSRSSLAD